jgi:hypothetical protein
VRKADARRDHVPLLAIDSELEDVTGRAAVRIDRGPNINLSFLTRNDALAIQDGRLMENEAERKGAVGFVA